MCRMWWPLTLTYIFKVIWPWLWKSCLLCNVFSSRSIIFLTWDPIVWVIMRRRGVSSERRRSSCSSSFRCSMTSPKWIRIYAAVVLQVHSGSGTTYATETLSLIPTNSDTTKWPGSAGKISATNKHSFIHCIQAHSLLKSDWLWCKNTLDAVKLV